jgi:hypothetical protein
VQGKRWFTDSDILEESVEGGQTVVSRPRAVATLVFEVLKKLPQERSIEIFDAQPGRRPSEGSAANWSNSRKASR